MIEEYKTQLKEVIEPSEGVMTSYKKLYKRNQSKWMRRSKLEVSDLDKEFGWDGKNYILEGAIDSLNMIVKETESNKYYRVHIDLVTHAFGLA